VEIWASTKATYRLLSNPKVNEEELFRAHREQTSRGFKGEELVLAIQDTTYLNYVGHESWAGSWVYARCERGIIKPYVVYE